MTKREEIARKLRRTLEHHGVVLHPDDIDGLALDALSILREPDVAMVEAGMVFVDGYYDDDRRETAHDIFTAMIDAADSARGEG
jgi:hypothetical protein